MFNELVESCAMKNSTNNSWTVIASAGSQIAILSLLVLAPLIYTQALPRTLLNSFVLAPAPPARVVQSQSVRHSPQTHRVSSRPLAAPRFIPQTVVSTPDEALTVTDLEDPAQPTMFENIPGDSPIALAKPVAPHAPEIKPIARIRQGGSVQQAMLLSQTRPVYPPLAIQAHIQGEVVLHAIIDKDGRVSQLEVISGHPLLIQAAIEAVGQWRYRPTLLNGDPVEVDTTITMSFRMGA